MDKSKRARGGVLEPSVVPLRPSILVVDDDEELRFFARRILESDYDVLEAATATEAAASIDSHPVDLVLLDLMLPGVSGITLCRQLKGERKDRPLPVIFLTAKTDMETKVEALEAGADDYVTKPFHHKELLSRIRVQLRIRELQREQIDAERLKAIVQTTISANHEVNNPLCAIITTAELMMELPEVRSSAQATLFLERIMGSAHRIEETMRKMAGIIQPVIVEYLPGVSMLDVERSSSRQESEEGR